MITHFPKLMVGLERDGVSNLPVNKEEDGGNLGSFLGRTRGRMDSTHLPLDTVHSG